MFIITRYHQFEGACHKNKFQTKINQLLLTADLQIDLTHHDLASWKNLEYLHLYCFRSIYEILKNQDLTLYLFKCQEFKYFYANDKKFI